MKTKIFLSALALIPALGMNANAEASVGHINFEFVNIRTNPSMDDRVSFVLKRGAEVTILEEKDGWSHIKSGNHEGWVQSNSIIKDEDNNNVKLNSNVGSQKMINNPTLNLRQGATTSSKIIAVLKKGDIVRLLEDRVGWCKVDFNGKVGYLSSRYLSDVNANTSSIPAKTIMTVTSNQLNVRREAKATSAKLMTIYKGDEVVFEANTNGWAKITKDGKTGYVSSYYLKDTGKTQEAPKDEINEAETKPSIDPNIANRNSNDEIQGGVSYQDMNMSLSDHVNMQMSNALNVSNAPGWPRATKEELTYLMDPNNFTDSTGMMQFVRLDRFSNCISVDQLNSYINRYCPVGNPFHNQGQAFINAAKKNNIDVIYLVAHSFIETGRGTSKLARGNVVNGKTVYNFFGIGAVDGNAFAGGTATAYKNGWTSVAAGIDGAATWISNRYIHSGKYDQNTLYKMKWSTTSIYHQYATAIQWPSHIGRVMSEIASYSNSTHNLAYQVPRYK